VQHVPQVIDRASLTEATELIAQFGAQARREASMRADRSRSLGNLIHFCRWRTVERAIEMLSDDKASGTIH
jgi:hypothetical protein